MRLSLSLFALALACATPALAQDAAPAAATQAQAPVTLGDLAISGAFSRATLPNAPVGGGFLSITNNGAEDDVLVSASAPIAAQTQLHEMSVEDGVMRMHEVEGGIPVPAGTTVTLSPGGLHIMFMGLTGAIVEGETVPVTLTFEKAGTVTIDLLAGPTASAAPAM